MCWRHSKLCIIEPSATRQRAVVNTMPRWKRNEHDNKHLGKHETGNIARKEKCPLWNPMLTSPRLPNRSE